MAVSVVDLDKCIGCGTCVVSCPMDVFRLDTVVVYRPERSPCNLACPLGVNQREYHDLLRTDRADEAAEMLGLCHPMPAVTGRLCPHPCETDCSRASVDEAVNINGLEQYLGDRLLSLDASMLQRAAGGDGVGERAAGVGTVAVIGSGPAGLAAAYFLALAGHEVTVFEKGDAPGGLLTTVIPAFRLPQGILDRQIDFYRAIGIVFRTGVQVGVDVTLDDLRGEGYQAFVAATGAAKSLGLAVPGVDAEGIVSAMDFLKGVKSGEVKELAGKVAVVGGGSVALDAARTAVRLGADEVSVVCLERLEPGLKDSMLALNEEIEDGRAEGIAIHPSRGVDSFVVEDGRVAAVRCVECLAVRDDDGRFNPVYADCVLPQVIEAETVIIAIGQTAEPELVPAGFAVDERGFIAVDGTATEAAAGLCAAGDAVSGPATVVEALAQGKRAALLVGRYLAGGDPTAGVDEEPTRAAEPPTDTIPTAARMERRVVPPAERVGGFEETVLPLDGPQAQMEADRCLTCGSRSRITYLDDCQACHLCQKYCPTEAIEVTEGILLGSLHGWDIVTLGR
ncbi:MAG: FAD-dependent oxidoreductase [Thermoleophilia bacterium]